MSASFVATTMTDTERPTVSVVLPTHNRVRLLPRAIRSVLAQSYRDLELIVVDDASTDETEAVLAAYDDRRLRVIRHDRNAGGAKARNTGIEAARGTYVAFQDSDDEWLLDKLEKQMGMLLSDLGEAHAVYCGFLRCGVGAPIYVPGSDVATRQGDIHEELLARNFVSTQTLVVRRAEIEMAGLFDESLGRFQDWDLAIRLAGIAHFRLVDEPLVIAHDTPGNISSDAAAGAKALGIILEKHRSTYDRHPAALATVLSGLGHLECLSGAATEGRRHFRGAVRLRPLAWKAWAALLLALLGSRAYRLANMGTSWLGRRARSTSAPAISGKSSRR